MPAERTHNMQEGKGVTTKSSRKNGGTTPDAPNFDAGDRALDREDDNPDTLVVLGEGDRADNHVAYQKWDGTPVTVADDNPEYPADDPVVLAAFKEDRNARSITDVAGFETTGAEDLLGFAKNADGVRVFAFPVRRLRLKPDAALEKIHDELVRLGWDSAEVDPEEGAVVVEKFGEHKVYPDGTVETDRETFREKLARAVEGVV